MSFSDASSSPTPPPTSPVSLAQSLRRPFENQERLINVVWGGLLMLVPFIGAIFVLGYSMRYLRQLIREREGSIPDWTEWGPMFVVGCLASVVSLVFTLIPFVVGIGMSVPAALSFFHGVAHENVLQMLSAFMIPLVVFCVLSILFSIPIPIALCLYADTDDFGAAFNFSRIIRLMTANLGEYLLIFITLIALGIAVAIAGAVVNVVPLLGQLASFVICIFGGFGLLLAGKSAFAEYYVKYRPE